MLVAAKLSPLFCHACHPKLKELTPSQLRHPSPKEQSDEAPERSKGVWEGKLRQQQKRDCNLKSVWLSHKAVRFVIPTLIYPTGSVTTTLVV
jgi:hypothetical protein